MLLTSLDPWSAPLDRRRNYLSMRIRMDFSQSWSWVGGDVSEEGKKIGSPYIDR